MLNTTSTYHAIRSVCVTLVVLVILWCTDIDLFRKPKKCALHLMLRPETRQTIMSYIMCPISDTTYTADCDVILGNLVYICRFSDAAKAFETCDRRFKAVFAEPKPTRQNSSSSLSLSYEGSTSTLDGLGRRVSGGSAPVAGGFNVLPGTPAAFGPPLTNRSFNNSAIFVKMATNGAGPTNGSQLLAGGVLPAHQHQEFTLNVICSALVNQDQLWRLFDIIPGLDYCQIIGESGPNCNRAIVKYNNLESCTYAKDKLHGLEYPLGERLIVKIESTTSIAANTPLVSASGVGVASAGGSSTSTSSSPGGRPLLSGVDLPMQAQMEGWDNNNLCSVALPPPAQLAFAGSACAQRCFLVCVSQVGKMGEGTVV